MAQRGGGGSHHDLQASVFCIVLFVFKVMQCSTGYNRTTQTYCCSQFVIAAAIAISTIGCTCDSVATSDQALQVGACYQVVEKPTSSYHCITYNHSLSINRASHARLHAVRTAV